MELTDHVCPQCGAPVRQAGQVCGLCGFDLAAQGELPTAAEWQAEHEEQDTLVSPAGGAVADTAVMPAAQPSSTNGSGSANGDGASEGAGVAAAVPPVVPAPGTRGADGGFVPPGQPPTPPGPPRRRRAWLVALVLGALVLGAAIAAGLVLVLSKSHTASPHVVTPPASQGPTPAAAPPSFQAIVADVKSGVIRINADQCDGRTAVGTGFLIGPTMVATADHVVDQSTSISLQRNGTILGTGTVVGSDTTRDLALVRSDTPLSGHVFRLASRAPQLGEPVAAIGFPLGLPLTVTRGSISGTSRSVPIEGVTRSGLVQTDAAVNPGNSGGPLLSTANGEVLGMVDAGGTGGINGVGFVIAARDAAPEFVVWRQSPQTATWNCSSPTPAPSPSPTLSPAPSPSPVPTPTPAPGPDQAPLNAVQSYWNDINAGDFNGAFQYLDPSTSGSESDWVAAHQREGITSATFSGHVTANDGSTATTAVDQLQTNDQASGCQNWSGSYDMVNQNGNWLIHQANLSPQPC